jgi:RNA polymerase-binding transcription factor DksA
MNTLFEQCQTRLIHEHQVLEGRIQQYASQLREYGKDWNIEALEQKDLEALRRVKVAEDRLASGNYGRCIHCGQSIETERLLHVPTAETCLACNQKNIRSYLYQVHRAS